MTRKTSTAARRLSLLLGALALAGLLCAGFSAAAKPAKTKTTRLSVKANGKEDPTASSDYPAISANGRFVAFESFGRLVSKDKDMSEDVYVYDRKHHKNSLVSVKSNGKTGNVSCGAADISPNGRYVSFGCEGALVGDDTNAIGDVYRHDRKTGKTDRVSLNGAGNELNGINDESEISGVADNGRVAWESYGAFVGNDTNNAFDVFVRTPGKGGTKRVSLDYQGQQLPDGVGSLNPDKQSKIAISGNGKFVAFTSGDQATAGTDYGMAFDNDIFIRNISGNKTTRVSLKSNGQEAFTNMNAPATQPSVSGDGRYVTFVSNAPFVGKDINNTYDVYVRDVKKGKTSLVSVKSNGKLPPTPSAGVLTPQFPEISANGRYVVFDTEENYGGGKDSHGFRDVYRRDLRRHKTKLVSLKNNGGRADTNQLADPSNNGWVVFSSMGKLTSGDDGNDFDVFLRGPLK